MRIFVKIQDFFAQLFAETGVAEPQASRPRLSDDLIVEAEAHKAEREEVRAEVDVRRSDLPDMPHELPRQTPLAPAMPEPNEPC